MKGKKIIFTFKAPEAIYATEKKGTIIDERQGILTNSYLVQLEESSETLVIDWKQVKKVLS